MTDKKMVLSHQAMLEKASADLLRAITAENGREVRHNLTKIELYLASTKAMIYEWKPALLDTGAAD